MKKSIKLIVGILIFQTVATIIMVERVNYKKALQEARATDGTDAAIEQAMMRRGYYCDANTRNRPLWMISKFVKN